MYVVELDDSASTAGKPCVYVGETGLTPEERFARHKAGRRASSVVKNHGLRLRHDLWRGIGPFETRDEALNAERNLAASLRAGGYQVFGGQGVPFRLGH